MKIYKIPTPPHLVRLQIARTGKGEKVEYLTLCETTPQEVEKFCKSVIRKIKISPFQSTLKTRIAIREAKGSKNGKSKSISFIGLSPLQTMDLIKEKLKTKI